MQLNRKGIPDELKETKNRELLSSEIYWDENSPLSISPYVAKTSKARKIILLFTAPPILGIKKDDGKSKLGIYKVYDFTKGRIDIIDQRTGFYTSKPKSRKWIKTVFSYVIEVSRVNSSTTFARLCCGMFRYDARSLVSWWYIFRFIFFCSEKMIRPCVFSLGKR